MSFGQNLYNFFMEQAQPDRDYTFDVCRAVSFVAEKSYRS